MIENFLNLSTTSVFTINQIDLWLFQNSHPYKKIHNLFYKKYLFELEDGSKVRLPPVMKKTDVEIFLNLYDSLNAISQFHKNEKYFEEQMARFKKVKNCETQLRDWIKSNEDIGSNHYACFLLDYLDYEEDEKVEHLNIYVLSAKHLEIYVDRKDFKHTIEFLETFNELYWS